MNFDRAHDCEDRDGDEMTDYSPSHDLMAMGNEIKRLNAEIERLRGQHELAILDHGIVRYAVATLHDEIKRLQKDAERLRAVNSAAHNLTSLLCGVRAVSEKYGHELIQRESVLDLVTHWRKQWDEAMK